MIFKKIKKLPCPATGTKILLGGVFAVLAILYAAFLFILPNVININNFTPAIGSEVEKLTGLKFKLVEPKLQTTWKMGVKLGARKLSFDYKDNSNFVSLVEPHIEINLPTLLLGHLNLDKIYVKEAVLNLVFTKKKNYTLEEYILKTLKNTSSTEKNKETKPLPIELKNINIEADKISLNLYDENLSKTFVTQANDTQVSLASLNGPLKIKTSGFMGEKGSNTHFSDFDIKLQTKLPDFNEVQTNTNNEPLDFQFNFNPFEGFSLFTFRSKLNADLKINEIGEKFNAKGYLNIDDVTFKINNYALPKSYIRTKFEKNTIITQSQFYISQEEFLKANNSVTTGKKPKINLEIKSDKISLNNSRILVAAILDMLKIENDLNSAVAGGYFNCDFSLNSDFKTVKSSGKLEVKDGSIKYPKVAIILNDINSFLDFSQNKITIKDTHAYLNGAKFAATGTIHTDTKLDLKIKSDPLKLSDIVNLALQFKLIKEKDISDFAFKGGDVVILADIGGDFKNIKPKADINLNKISILLKSLKMPLTVEKLNITALPDLKNKNDFSAEITAQNFNASMKNPNFNTSVQKCVLTANSKDINIAPFNINLNGSPVDVSGTIKNYIKKPELLVNINGKLNPNTVISFIPAQNGKYITSSGNLPFNANLSGTPENIKITGNLTTNASNHISIVDIKNLRKLENKLSADLNLKGDTLLINSLGVISKGVNVANVSGKITNIYAKTPQFAPLNIVVPQKLSVVIPVLDKLSLDADANIALNGNIYAPQITGLANISNFNYPQFQTAISNIVLDFKKTLIGVRADGIKVAGSDFSGSAEILSDFSKNIIINSLDFTSAYIDTDALLKLLASMPNTQTTAGPSLPLTIKNGTGKISKLKSGNIIAQSANFNFNLYNNLVKITNIVAIFADGKITADAQYNISNTKVVIDGVAKSLNVKKAASCFIGASSILLGGTLNGVAKLNFRGTTYEQQINSLNGQVFFDISNGQFGEAARFERFLQAGNLLSQSILNLNLNQTISAVTNRNTGEFKKLEGKMSLSNGWANITSIESQGSNMSLYITGKYNILTGNSDLKILGRISSVIVNVLGPLGSFSLDKVVDKLPAKGVAIINTIKSIAPANPLFAEINKEDLAKIPPLGTATSDTTSKDFQVLINGQIDKTTSIKSFKWAKE